MSGCGPLLRTPSFTTTIFPTPVNAYFLGKPPCLHWPSSVSLLAVCPRGHQRTYLPGALKGIPSGPTYRRGVAVYLCCSSLYSGLLEKYFLKNCTPYLIKE